ncbi:copper amine oxidase [Spongiactinospora sp. TRM90649]|uniref:copper amine oxidase n=1 Tax=Spongiactinospora sp. TRM90649 TaxID=3031114 RepID=UPI0023F6DDAF|nr:copper amine oxidase [Spongiactinospora sp. TRM90649]MDF5755301.1 copper amine oxidase [Spongiactinospora sp. TRM90649]
MRSIRAAAMAACLLLALLPAVAPAASALSSEAAPEAAAPCSKPYLVEREFKNGARWSLCWEMREIEGLTLTKVVYTPRGHKPVSVLRSGHLAQIHVPYDSGEPRFQDMAGGLGSSVVPLQTQDCPEGERRVQDDIPMFCVLPDQARGLAYLRPSLGEESLRASVQGKELVVFSAFEIGWYTYLVEWRFADDGSITPRVGATGSLRGSDGIVVSPKHGWPIGVGSSDFEESHSHNIFWRLDFDIQGPKDDAVEQFDFTGSGTAKRVMKTTALAKEASAKNDRTRWWRVVDKTVKNADDHPASWEINNSDSAEYRGPASEKFSQADVYVTQYRKCERLASENAEPPCKGAVNQYVNGQTITDPVVWVSVDFHHVARDEDQDPMPTHWQGFHVAPRDITAKNPH